MNKDLDERKLLLQTLGLRLFIRFKDSDSLPKKIREVIPSAINIADNNGIVELLNWDERQGNVYIKTFGRKYWLPGLLFEEVLK